MVSNARLDLPEPLRPVITTNLPRGIVTSMFFRLCSRAPLTTISSFIAAGELYRFLARFSRVEITAERSLLDSTQIYRKSIEYYRLWDFEPSGQKFAWTFPLFGSRLAD